MKKSKLCGLAIAAFIGGMAFNPATVTASDISLEPVSVSEPSREQKELKAAFNKKMEKANETWKSLTNEQRNEIYVLLESEVEIEIQVLNKLVEFNILEEQDAKILETYMRERFNELKKKEDFPLFRSKGKKSSR